MFEEAWIKGWTEFLNLQMIMNSVLSKCLRFIVEKNIFFVVEFFVSYRTFDAECLRAALICSGFFLFRRTESF